MLWAISGFRDSFIVCCLKSCIGQELTSLRGSPHKFKTVTLKTSILINSTLCQPAHQKQEDYSSICLPLSVQVSSSIPPGAIPRTPHLCVKLALTMDHTGVESWYEAWTDIQLCIALVPEHQKVKFFLPLGHHEHFQDYATNFWVILHCQHMMFF